MTSATASARYPAVLHQRAHAPDGLRPMCVRHDGPKSVNPWQTSSRSTAGRANGQGKRQGNWWSQQAVRKGTVHRFRRRDTHPVCDTVQQRVLGQGGKQDARATRVPMHMQTVRALIVLGIVRPIVVMMMSIVLIMMMAVMVVAVIVVMVVPVMSVLPIVLMGVDEKPREGAHRYGKGHADPRRQGKHKGHRPNEGDAPSARPVQSRQHRFRQLSQGGPSKACPQAGVTITAFLLPHQAVAL